MAINEGLWQAIQAGVYALPHKVEWYEPEEMKKAEASQPARLSSEVRTMFVVPRGWADLMGGRGALWDRCQELADETKCDLFKANDGSLIFKTRLG